MIAPMTKTLLPVSTDPISNRVRMKLEAAVATKLGVLPRDVRIVGQTDTPMPQSVYRVPANVADLARDLGLLVG